MPRIIVKSQAELDALPMSFKEYTIIEINSPADICISVTKAWERSHVEARESSHVVAWGSSHVEAWGSSHVEAWGRSHVEARESSHVEARESSHVVAWGRSHVETWGRSHVEARGRSHVVARGRSHVEAWERSHVEAWESSHVVAWGRSHVEAWGSSHVEARESSAVHVHSEYSTITLFAFAAAWLIAKAKVTRKSKTCTVITPKKPATTKTWIDEEGVDVKAKFATVFKRVSKNWKTQESTHNETTWAIGTTLKHATYKPKGQECGANKFHACSKAYFCNEFRSTKGDRYVAIKVPVASLHYWGANASYPHKVAFGEGKVMYECDRYGKKLVS